MRWGQEPHQRQFTAAVRGLLSRECTGAALRAAWDSPTGSIPGLWPHLAGLGLTALTVPAGAGGAGGDETDLVAVLEEAGRVALPEPLLETMVGARLLADTEPERAAEWLPRIADGQAVLAIGLGPGRHVTAAAQADLFLLRSGAQLHALPRADLEIVTEPSADAGLSLAQVRWQPGDATRLGAADPAATAAAIDRALDVAVLGAAAELVGLAAAMLDMSVDYAGQRHQFGRPIGSFQAVQHRLADVYVALEFARPVLARGAWSAARDLPTRARDVSMAKHCATRAARLAGQVALQTHGAIGYTYEHGLHMWQKRSWSLAGLWGNEAWHRERVAAAVLDEGQPRVP